MIVISTIHVAHRSDSILGSLLDDIVLCQHMYVLLFFHLHTPLNSLAPGHGALLKNGESGYRNSSFTLPRK